MRRLILWLTRTRFFRWLLIDVIPYIRFTLYYTSFPGSKYIEGYRVLTPKHFILAKDSKKLTTLLVNGFMTHAGKCVNRRRDGVMDPVISNEYVTWDIAEMTHKNYTKSHFFDICKESDRVLICRCVDYDDAYSALVNFFTVMLQNSIYDVQFTLGVEALYCSELVYQADRLASEKNGLESPVLNADLTDSKGLGTKYISPDGLLFASNVICDWDSSGEFTGMMGPAIEQILISRGDI